MCLESFQTIWKLFRHSGTFPDYLETFQTLWKISRESGNLFTPNLMFRVHCKANFLNTRKNFPDAQKTFRLAMHTSYSGFWDSDPNLLEDNSFAGKMSRNNKSDFFANSSLKRQFGSFGGLNLTCAFTSCERFCATIDFLARNDEPYHHHIEYHSMSAFSQTER